MCSKCQIHMVLHMCRAVQMTKKLRNRKQMAAQNSRTFVRILYHISVKDKVIFAIRIITLHTCMWLHNLQSKRGSICDLLLETIPLKGENQKLQDRLKRRNKQLKTLAQNIAEHRTATERFEREMEIERSKTQDLLELLEGLKISMQSFEATKPCTTAAVFFQSKQNIVT